MQKYQNIVKKKWKGKLIVTGDKKGKFSKSKEYEWECKNGHIFSRSPEDIDDGLFCDKCERSKDLVDTASDVISILGKFVGSVIKGLATKTVTEKDDD